MENGNIKLALRWIFFGWNFLPFAFVLIFFLWMMEEEKSVKMINEFLGKFFLPDKD